MSPEQGIAGGMPAYALHPTAKDEFKGALELIQKYGNSDEFYRYVLKRRKYFKHTEHSVANAVRIFRSQLNKGGLISIEFTEKFDEGDYLGAWNGYEIKESLSYKMTEPERAGHLMHETAHSYGWKHKGNDGRLYDNQNSFPYAIGYDFHDFLVKVVKHPKKTNSLKSIRSHLISNLTKFRYCYQKEIEMYDYKSRSKAVFILTINSQGKLVKGEMKTTSDITGEMKRCMTQVLISIKFPPQSKTVTQAHAFNFYSKE